MFVPSTRRNPLRNLARYMAWQLGELVANALSWLNDFRLPNDALQPYAQKLPMLLGFYESETQELMRKLVKPGDIVIDGGAHAGFYTRLLSKLVGPTGKVIAVEAHPATEALLRRNVGGLGNVQVAGCALGATDGETLLFEQTSGSAGHSTSSHKPGLVASRTVSVRPLPALLEEYGLSRFDFLKLDIEGTEPEVLATLDGMDRLDDFSVIFEIKRYILEASGLTPEELLRKLLESGYKVMTDDCQLVAGNDVAARNPRFDKANILLLKGAAVGRLS